jgi:hypothetical protein
MPTTSINSGLRDNHTRGTVADFLKGGIRDGSRLSVVSAYFTIYAYDGISSIIRGAARMSPGGTEVEVLSSFLNEVG